MPHRRLLLRISIKCSDLIKVQLWRGTTQLYTPLGSPSPLASLGCFPQSLPPNRGWVSGPWRLMLERTEHGYDGMEPIARDCARERDHLRLEGCDVLSHSQPRITYRVSLGCRVTGADGLCGAVLEPLQCICATSKQEMHTTSHLPKTAKTLKSLIQPTLVRGPDAKPRKSRMRRDQDVFFFLLRLCHVPNNIPSRAAGTLRLGSDINSSSLPILK